VVTVCIIVLFCLFTVTFQWYFNPSRLPQKSDEEIIEECIANLGRNNGAKYYLMACLRLADSLDDDAILELLESVMENGWQEEYPDLERYIGENGPALELVREGAKQEFCSIPIAESFSDTSSMLYLSGFRHIARLLIAEAKLFEKNAEYDRAAETYTTLLRFAASISSGTIIHTFVGIAIERWAYKAMGPYLTELKEEKICESLLAKLLDIENNRAQLTELLRDEFSHEREMNKSLEKEWLYFRDTTVNPTVIDYFVDTTRKAGGYLLVRLYMFKSKRAMEEFHELILEASERSYPEIFSSNLKDKIPDDKVVQILFGPIYKGIFTIGKGDVIRRGNIIKLALHLHLLRNGVYPDTLVELVPIVPAEILKDPFSTESFIYMRTDSGYVLYGVGPDMDDDGGREIEPPYSLDNDGDMVFVTARTVR